MSWIQENKTQAAILGVSGAGVVGMGVWLFMAFSSYSESLDAFDSANGAIATLKRAPLAPTEPNLQAKKALVEEYQAAVNRLNLVLERLQVPDQPTTDTEFQAKLKTKIAEIKRKAAELRIDLPAEFNLGFDRYTSALPRSHEVATELMGYLNAVEEIMLTLMESGVRRLDMLERSDLPAEVDPARPGAKGTAAKGPAAKGPAAKGVAAAKGAAAAPAKVTTAHQVRLLLTADQAALQLVMSKLANPSDMPNMPYFPIVRLLRIENERQEGPPRIYDAPPAPPPPSPDAPVVSGTQPAPPDAVAVLGQERLRAFLEIDLVKFLNPQAPAAPQQPGSR